MRRHLRILACAVPILLAALAPARAAPPDPSTLILVASASDPEIAVIDSTTDRLVTRVRLPVVPRRIGAFDRGRALVVGDGVQRRLYILEPATGMVRRELETSVTPVMLQIERSGDALAVGDPAEGTVEIVRTDVPRTGGVAPVKLSGLQGFRAMAFDGRGRLLVAAGSRILVIDAATGSTVATLAAGDENGPISQIAIDPGGEYAFAPLAETGILSVFELKTLRRTARIALPPPVGRLLASADSQFMLLPVEGGRALSVLSTWTLEESVRIPMAAAVDGVGLGLFQSVSVGLGRASRSVQPVDLRDQRALAPLSLPGTPVAGAASPDGVKFYVALGETGQIVAIDLLHGTAGAVIEGAVRDPSAILSAADDGYCH